MALPVWLTAKMLRHFGRFYYTAAAVLCDKVYSVE